MPQDIRFESPQDRLQRLLREFEVEAGKIPLPPGAPRPTINMVLVEARAGVRALVECLSKGLADDGRGVAFLDVSAYEAAEARHCGDIVEQESIADIKRIRRELLHAQLTAPDAILRPPPNGGIG